MVAWTALAIAVVGVGLIAVGRSGPIATSRAPAIVAVLLSVALTFLAWALVSGDYRLVYVAEASSRSSSWPYRLAGLWGGMAGSLLFWTTLLALTSVAAIRLVRRHHPDLVPAVAGSLTALIAGFLGVGLFLANPFDRLAVPAIDGAGLAPILEHPAMIYHPPLLYLGLVSTAVLFALAVAGLVRRRCDEAWLGLVRRGAAVSWLLLSVGMLAGAHWAYVELGWGGFWAWDPVENAALLPWLGATALVHAVMVDQHRRQVRPVTVALALATHLLALIGTLLTRSGAVSSVHAFAEAVAVGRALLVLVIGAVVSTTVLWWRRRPPPPSGGAPGRTGRRQVLAANAMVMIGLIVVVAWGTGFPLLAELVGWRPVVVGGQFFARLGAPFALAILALVGLAPVLRWRGGLTPGGRRCLPVAAAGAALAGGTAILGGVRSPFALAAFPLAGGSAVLLTTELARRFRAPGPARARRRAAGAIAAHLGVVLFLTGVAGSTLGTTDTIVLRPGTTASVGGYDLRHEGASVARVAGSPVITVEVGVSRDGKAVATLRPTQAVFENEGRVLSETALRSTPLDDLLVAIRRVGDDGTTVLEVSVRPLAVWVWWGGLLTAAGGALSLSGPIRTIRRITPPTAEPPDHAGREPGWRPASSADLPSSSVPSDVELGPLV